MAGDAGERGKASVWVRTGVLAGLAGWGFAWLGSPLPWLIGPLLATGGLRLAGMRLDCPVAVRCAGQWVIGAALGLYFTPAVLAQLGRLAGAIAVGVLLAWTLTIAVGWVLHRIGRLDPATAFFAGAIGSATEMALQGERHGARFELVAAVHSVRVLIVVVGIPWVYRWLGLHGSDPYTASVLDVRYSGLLALVAVSLLVVALFSRLRWPNAWMLGPLVVAATATAMDSAPSALPGWMVVAGQVFIGAALGVRFRPESMALIRRIVPLVVLTTAGAIGVAALVGALLAWLVGLPVATLILATSPGGIAEMSLTAKVLQLGVPVVTAFQVARMIGMVLTVGPLYRMLAKSWPRHWAVPPGGSQSDGRPRRIDPATD